MNTDHIIQTLDRILTRHDGLVNADQWEPPIKRREREQLERDNSESIEFYAGYTRYRVSQCLICGYNVMRYTFSAYADGRALEPTELEQIRGQIVRGGLVAHTLDAY